MFNRLGFVALMSFLLLANCSGVARGQVQPRQWKVGEDTRDALVYFPAAAKTKASPVVFVFHGHGGTMRHAARSFAMHKQWPEAICVYMQGLNTPGRLTDPEGKKPGWQSQAGDQDDRDLKFFDVVLKSLHDEAKVDDARVFAMGHSNGGGFTYLLWSQRGDKLAAIAPSASIAASRMSSDFKPLPVLHIAGRNDPLVKFSWQEKMVELIKRVNQCDGTHSAWAEGRCEVYASKAGAPLVVCYHDGNHQYPEFAPELIAKFFKESGARTEAPVSP